MRKYTGESAFACVMFIDLSKAFDTMNHDSLIAKLVTYAFHEGVLSFTQQSVNSNFSTPERTISGVSQG